MTIFPPVSATWPRDSGPATLPPGSLHIWLVDRNDWKGCDWSAVLSEAELARTARYHHAADRDRAAMSRGVLRRLLGGYLGTSPATIAIETSPFGKPRLVSPFDGDTIAFNASGSADLAVFAFTRGAAVGVDIEAFTPTPGARGKTPPSAHDVRTIAARFAADERTLIDDLPDDEATVAFMRLWTCKEACVKCHGSGLQTPLDQIRIELIDASHATGRLGDERFSIRSFAAEAGSIAAVAVPGESMPEPSLRRLVP